MYSVTFVFWWCLAISISGEASKEKNAAGHDWLVVPDFFVIGAMKCGTTSLNKLFFEHPSICSEGVKEKHFFDKEEFITDYDAHVASYNSEFAGCKRGEMTIDSTPSYIQSPLLPARLNESYTPEALARKKFILILREPVARHYSEYQMRLRVCFHGLYNEKGNDDDGAEERLERNCKRVMHDYSHRTFGLPSKRHKFMTFAYWSNSSEPREITRGYYLDHIKAWLQVINRKQLFVLNFQTLIANTSDTMFRIGSFLGIDASKWIKGGTSTTIELPVPKSAKVSFRLGYLDCHTYDTLRSIYDAHNPNLAVFINSGGRERRGNESRPLVVGAGGRNATRRLAEWTARKPGTTRPLSEPDFPSWDYSKRSCVDVEPGDGGAPDAS